MLVFSLKWDSYISLPCKKINRERAKTNGGRLANMQSKPSDLPKETQQEESLKISNLLKEIQQKESLRETAENLIKCVNDWLSGENKDLARKRWIWELIQNARDVAAKYGKENFTNKFIWGKDKVFIFQHDAGPFTLRDVDAIIRGRSSKWGERDALGKFFEGFIITHILSTKVRVSGLLKDQERSVEKPFLVELDRDLRAPMEKNIEHFVKNIKDCMEQLDHTIQLDTNMTNFEYLSPDEESINAGLNELKKVGHFVVAFCEPSTNIEVCFDGSNFSYKIEEKELLHEEEEVKIELLKFEGGRELILATLTLTNLGKIKMLIPCSREGEQVLLEEVDETIPRFFHTFPLTKTTGSFLPVIISAPFEVSSKREDISYASQREPELTGILQALESLFEKVYRWIIGNPDIKNKEVLFKIKSRKGGSHKEKLDESLKKIVEKLSEKEIVQSNEGRFLKPREACFPSSLVGEDQFKDEEFLKKLSSTARLLYKDIPADEVISKWEEIRSSWKSLGYEIGKEIKLEDLVKEVEDCSSLTTLGKKICDRTRHSALYFLDQFYELCKYYVERKGEVPTFLMDKAVYCNQDGNFKKPKELYIDDNIPNEIKEISKLTFPLQELLLEEELSKKHRNYFEKLNINKMSQEKSVEELYFKIVGRWELEKNNPKFPNFKEGVCKFEKWLLLKERAENLKRGGKYELLKLPFLCEDNILRKLNGDYFIPPRPLLKGKKAEKYLEIWPRDVRLSERYAEDEDKNKLLECLADADICCRDLFYQQTRELTDEEVKKMRGESYDWHKIYKASICNVVQLDKVLRQVENEEQTKNILTFVLEYLVEQDKLWKQEETQVTLVPKNLYGQPTIESWKASPSLWFLRLKESEWIVTKGKKPEKPSRENLKYYLPKLPQEILTRDNVQEFLSKFDISRVETASTAVTRGNSNEEKKLTDFLREVSKNRDILDKASEMVELRSKIRYNQAIGIMVQIVAQLTFQREGFSTSEFSATRRGFDFRAIYSYRGEKDLEQDCGRVEIKRQAKGQEYVEYLIEVKATTQPKIKMTQSQIACAKENEDRYLLCVVDLREHKDFLREHKDLIERLVRELESKKGITTEEIIQQVSEITPEEIIQKIPEKIIQQVSDILKVSYIGKSIGSILDKLIELESMGVNSEISVETGNSLRFLVSEKLWKDKGVSFKDWVKRERLKKCMPHTQQNT